MSSRAEYARRYNGRLRMRPDPDSVVCPHPGFGYEISVPDTEIVQVGVSRTEDGPLERMSKATLDLLLAPIGGARKAA